MPKQKDAYYFPHDSNARNDQKILSLRADYGYEGYGLFWGIIECLREQKDFKLDFSSINMLSIALHFDADKLKDFINSCIEKYHLFELKEGKFYSNRLLRAMRKRMQLHSKMKANALQRWKSPDAIAKHKRKGKERKGKEITTDVLPVELSAYLNQDDWTEWANYRKEIKKPLTQTSIKKQVKFLLRQSDPKECIENAIMNGWQGLFEVKSNGTHKPIEKVLTPEEIEQRDYPFGRPNT